jgi:transcriptional regulator with XRE-family HTH domain
MHMQLCIMPLDLLARVKLIMAEQGMSQDALAESCGLSQGHLSKILAGRPMGARAEARLRAWVEGAAGAGLDSDEILRLGRLLKRKCEELASLQRRLSNTFQDVSP